MATNTEHVHDDYSLVRVPPEDRRSWISVAFQRFGQVSSFQQFLVGASLGYGMNFWDAVLAITIGSVMLEVITIALGIAGVKEGLSTSVLARWSGLGRKGSVLVGLLVAVSLAGWFGVQNGVFAEGMVHLTHFGAEWMWAIGGGVAVTAIAVYGFSMMTWTAYLTVPAFLLLAGMSIVDTLSKHSLVELINSPHPGPAMSLGQGITLVAGAFMVGAIMTPDMTRFNRTSGDVFKQTLISVTVGEYLIGLISVLLTNAAGKMHLIADKPDVVAILTSPSGVLGTLILIMAILKINDWNLYSSSLGMVNSLDVLFGKKVGRTGVTLILGAIGTFLSAIGMVHHFEGFLSAIGMLAPPVADIIIAEYFVVRRFRSQLDQSRRAGTLPPTPVDWVPLSLVAWAVGTATAMLIPVGIATINSVVVGFAVYAVAGLIMRKSSGESSPIQESPDLAVPGGR